MRYLLLLVATLGAPALAAERRPLAVAAAANLKPALAELERAFESAHPGVDVRVTYGASGAFFAQVRSGAPLDLFFSADREYPRKLVAAGLARDEVVYAIGKLALWIPAGSTLDERRGLGALADPAVRKVAIANPAVAPYGRAAEEALRAAGVLDAVRPKLVLGTSAMQAAQFARSGAADAALVPRSLATSPELAGHGRSVPVPDALYAPIEQSAAVLAAAREPALAGALLAFARGAEGRRILARHGYALP